MTPLLSCRVSGHPVPHTLYGTNNCFRINWVIHAIFLVFFSEGFKYVLLYIMHFKCLIVPCTIGLNVHVKCILQQTASKRFLPFEVELLHLREIHAPLCVSDSGFDM